MKRIIAIIKPNMLDDVIFALHQVKDFPGATMTDVRGMGRGIHRHVKESQLPPSFGYPAQVRIEIVCIDDQVDEIVTTIERNAQTGKQGDGKIFTAPVDGACRISTGQRGEDAIEGK
jgi:nitrogen regulatory protein PII